MEIAALEQDVSLKATQTASSGQRSGSQLKVVQ
jgi:hypothetical protein